MAEGASTAVAIADPPRKSVLVDMSNRYGMEPAAFEATVRATCMRPDRNGNVPSREEFAAFLLVAKEYKLNPLTREIFAFTAKGGGIVPIVSVDGWINLINSHPASDGFEFDFEHDGDGKLISCTCRMYRKDRSRPVVVTEWLSECIRNTEPWNMKHRMLRHKTLVQAARYAFGFAGIYDEDEGRRIVENRSREIQGEFTEVDDGGGPPVPEQSLTDPEPATATHTVTTDVTATVATVDDGGGPPVPTNPKYEIPADGSIPDFLRRQDQPKPAFGDEEREWLESLDNAFSGCEDMGSLANEKDRLMQPFEGSMPTAAWNRACEILDEHIERIQTQG